MRTSVWLVLALGCGPSTPSPQPPAPVHADCPEPAKPPDIKPLDDAQVRTLSTAYLDAWAKRDASAVAGQLAASFGADDSGALFDGKEWRGELDAKDPPWTITVGRSFATGGASGGVFVTEAIEHHKSDEPHRETLVWTREGDGWKVAFQGRGKGGVERERERWNDAFRAKAAFKTAPNQLLVDTVKGKKAGTALDLASGQGRNALFLAKAGWKTTAIDISDEGLFEALQSAMHDNVKLDAVEADFTAWDYGTAKWDLVTMLYAGADPAVIDKAKAGIKKGGLFVCEFFADGQGPPGFAAGQPAAQFKDGWKIVKDDVVEDVSDWGQVKVKLVRFVAQKQ